MPSGCVSAALTAAAYAGITTFLAAPQDAFETATQNSSVRHRSVLEGPFPNKNLPPQIQAEMGKLSLFADFADRASEGIPLYLVNRTKDSISLPTQDGALFVKLMVKPDPSGPWQRAQSHASSDCGNSYYSFTLGSGFHYRIWGYAPAEGIAAEGRYQMFRTSNDVVSNEGALLFSPDDLRVSASDQQALLEHPLISAFHWYQGPALEEPLGKILAKLDLVQTYENGRVFAAVAESARKRFAGVPEGKQVIAGLQSLETRAMEAGPQPARLIARCLSELNAADGQPFGSPARFPELLWASLFALREHATLKDWEKAFTLLRLRLPSAAEEERGSMIRILLGSEVHEHLDDGFLKNTAIHDHLLRGPCLAALAARNSWSTMEQAAARLDLPGRLQVLRYYCAPTPTQHPGSFRSYSGQEFWKGCLSDDLPGSLNAMREAAGYEAKVYFEPELSLAIGNELERWVEKYSREPWPDDPSVGVAFQFLMEADIRRAKLVLLRSLKASKPAGETEAGQSARAAIADAAEGEMLRRGWRPDRP